MLEVRKPYSEWAKPGRGPQSRVLEVRKPYSELAKPGIPAIGPPLATQTHTTEAQTARKIRAFWVAKAEPAPETGFSNKYKFYRGPKNT